MIFTESYTSPTICKEEILRYAGCRRNSEEITKLLDLCLEEVADKISYRVCYGILPVKAENGVCDFGTFKVKSNSLALSLKECESALIFAATLGHSLDRLIAKYSVISPSKALMFQAIGAERTEAVCNCFVANISKKHNFTLNTRFSPGYADLPLEFQTEIFAFLDCERKIGLTLNKSMIMSPSKSVTAIAGILN